MADRDMQAHSLRGHTRDATRRELLLFIGTYLLGSLVSALFDLSFFAANLLMLGVPTSIILMRTPKLITRLHPLFCALLLVLSCAFFGELNERYGGWYVPSIFTTRIGHLAVEEVEFAILFIGCMLLGYERFARCAEAPLAPVRNRGAGVGLVVLFLAGVACAIVPVLQRRFAGLVYLKTCVFFTTASLALAIYDRPVFLREFGRLLLLGIPMVTVMEVVGLRQGYWTFPGRYVAQLGWSWFAFPLEELLFFIVLCWPVAAAVHSVFVSCLWRPAVPVECEWNPGQWTAAS
jgi:hypothetical protein